MKCQDMVAFSCCIFDGGHKELEDMKAAREKGWKGKFTKPGRVIRPGAIRVNGKCPMTPLEVLAVSAFALYKLYFMMLKSHFQLDNMLIVRSGVLFMHLILVLNRLV